MNNNGRITVYSQKFSVPGAIVESALNTVKLSYHPPGGSRQDWFHALGIGGERAGRRMGDTADDAVRYSIAQEAA
jgi:hypothetical protein